MNRLPGHARRGFFVLLVASMTPAALTGQATLAEPGQRLYESLCARCHGIEGVGGQGPSLRQPVLRQAPDDESLRSVIIGGIPAAGMPSIVGSATPGEITQLVAYVRSLGRRPPETGAGDAGRGRALFRGRGDCMRCHVVAGTGGILGPDLTSVGLSRGAAYLRASLVEPERELPIGSGIVYPGSGHARFLLVRAVLASGRQVLGVRLNEDAFTIQLRDGDGRLHSFNKPQLRSLEKYVRGSLMPAYRGALSSTELDDVVAYLLTLRGQP
jgi:putative heme-binding domain-containing protein